MTRMLRASQQLLVSYIKLHKAITRYTLARWTIRVLKMAGINTDKYASHSTLGAMASKARLLGISVKKNLAHAGWKTAKSFAKHYNKRLEKPSRIADRLLSDNLYCHNNTLLIHSYLMTQILEKRAT